MRPSVDVLVIGAGQAGLAAIRALRNAGLNAVAHDRHRRVGDSWRARFDSLVLFTPRALSALPGLPHVGDPQQYPSKDEMGDYLERYAETFALPVVTDEDIVRLAATVDGNFAATTRSGGTLEARAVVVATGAFQQPRVPSFARSLAPHVQQLDAESYRNPSGVADGHVAVIGDGATGRQIALELSRARPGAVTLATGRKRRFGPQRILGRDTTELALRTGLLTADKRTPAGRLVRWLDMTPGLELRVSALKRAGVHVVPRCAGADGDRLQLADGSVRRVNAVIYAIGYRDETEWLDIEGVTRDGALLHDRGVAPVPGLFYVGREWQTSRASALVCGVHLDATAIAARVARHLDRDTTGRS